jgi:multimeric flavodoxin WrbA
MVKVLGIVGSPRKYGHTALLVKEALKAAEEIEHTETELIHIADKKILPCTACLKCAEILESPFCILNDDMTREIYDKLMEANGIIIGTPTYFMSVPAQLKALMDRCIAIKTRKFWLRDKVGAALAVAAHPYGGQAAAIEDIQRFFLANGMIVVNDGAPSEEEIEESKGKFIPRSRVSAIWSRAHYPAGYADPDPMGKIVDDEIAVLCAKGVGRHVAQVAKWIKVGRPSLSRKIYPLYSRQ